MKMTLQKTLNYLIGVSLGGVIIKNVFKYKYFDMKLEKIENRLNFQQNSFKEIFDYLNTLTEDEQKEATKKCGDETFAALCYSYIVVVENLKMYKGANNIFKQFKYINHINSILDDTDRTITQMTNEINAYKNSHKINVD